MAVGTVSEVFYNSKSKTKIPKNILYKQAGKNVLWAGISACLFAYPLAKIYESAKKTKNIMNDNSFSQISAAAAAVLMGFRLYVASRPHPKWKNAKLGTFF